MPLDPPRDAERPEKRADAAEVLDLDVLADLRALDAGSDEALLPELVDLFRAEGSAKIAELRLAVEAANADRLRRAAHSLKGSSAGVGAASLTQLAESVEQFGRSESVAGAEPHIDELEREFERIVAALRSWLEAA